MQEQLPSLGRREAVTARWFIAFVVARNGKFLVRQRPLGVVNAHLWEFPNVEIGARLSEPQRVRTAAHSLELEATDSTPLCIIKHSITRYRITLGAYRAKLAKPQSRLDARCYTLRQLHKLAFTSAHKKILHAVAADVKSGARARGRHSVPAVFGGIRMASRERPALSPRIAVLRAR